MIEYDGIGPEKILEIYNPKLGMKGYVVIHSTALGPGKGGIRMTPSVDKDEVFRLARAMSYKCSLHGLPFGGAKSGIIADDRNLTKKQKKEIVEAFADALKVVCPDMYVAAPDMNMAEEEMRWFAKKVGSKKACTGKPKDMGGIPHELGSTGFGVYHATLVGLGNLSLDVKDVSFAVEGFGNVGWFACKYLTEAGARLAAVSDSKGMIYNENGLNFKKLDEVKRKTGSIVNYKDGKVLKGRDIISVDCDVLITAAIPDLISVNDVNKIKAKLIVEGSNIPMSDEAEEKLHSKGILVIPDFVANAGGVISSYVEYINGSVKTMFKMVEDKITKTTNEVLKLSSKEKCKPRDIAMRLARKRILSKCKICRG